MAGKNLEYMQDTQTLVGSRKRELIDVQTGEQIFVDQVILPRAFLRTGGGVSHFPKNSIDKISGQAKQGAVYYIYI